jgi:hypothetical protein
MSVRGVLHLGSMPRRSASISLDATNLCTCTVCGRVYQYDRRQGHTRVRCNSCGSNRATRAARRALKERMVEYKGGRCHACGFDESLAALSFHHRNPALKSLGIAGSHARSWAVLRRELDKCDLLCLNCHLEAHEHDRRLGPRTSAVDPSEIGRLCRCVSCGREYVHNWRKGHTRQVCNSCRTNRGGRAARRLLKQRLVEQRGGRCELCGYSRSLRALCFHHRDETSKRFQFAGSHLRSWEALTRELEKCILLCQNCHVTAHDAAFEARARARLQINSR